MTTSAAHTAEPRGKREPCASSSSEGTDASHDSWCRVWPPGGDDAVVYAARSGDGTEEQLWAVDFGGVTTAVAAAELTDVSRFVHIFTLGAGGPLPAYVGGPWWEAYFGAKTKADAALATSRLNWTSARPGLLTDENPTGLIQVGDRLYYAPVTRADVANTIIAVLTVPSTYRRAFDVVGGPCPIDEALADFR
ncbi:NAD(P)H-binding protein [Streptomyces tendae]|uniref:NAD(P)H-binding protein n=1 Tax=Streptomyces tendae TaxID=1932 RepID=UPI0033DDBF8C